jgi:hypothetical protein
MNATNAVIAIIVLAVGYLITALLVMLAWNNGVKPAVKDGSVNKLSYGNALAMTLFLMLVFGTPIILVQPPVQKAMSFR